MEPADLALVLAFDGSASVTLDEFALMANATGEALRDPGIVAGMLAGERRASAVALLLWSGADAQEVLVEWTRVASAEDAERLADAVRDAPRVVRAGLTAIGAALGAAEALLGAAAATRRVVDVVGDGRSNDGPPPGPVRDRLAAAGVTVNGLCLLHEEADLLESYERDVIGGPGAFALPCPDYAAFAEAMRRKLLREVTVSALPANPRVPGA